MPKNETSTTDATTSGVNTTETVKNETEPVETRKVFKK